MSRPQLELDRDTVKQARSLARKVGRPIVRLAKQHTTVSVERATLRMAGLAGADPEGTPWVNRLVDVVRADRLDRLRDCEADDCTGVFVDLSKNGSKRFCSARCGNRIAVRAYRARALGD